MAISILMKAQCAERVIQKYPRLKLAPDWRMWISSEDFEQICDKASLSLTVEEVECRLAKWKWGTEELECLRAALLQAREAIRDVQTTAQIRERIPDWPWHRVDISEFKKAIKEDDGDEDDGGRKTIVERVSSIRKGSKEVSTKVTK